MPEIKEQVQKLIIESKTEEALEALIEWIKSKQSNELNEAIILRSRYEQAERDLGMNLISPEDAARVFSQINFSLLNLVDNLEKKTFAPGVIPAKRRGWLLALTSSLLILVLAMFILKILFPSRELRGSEQTEKSTQISDNEERTIGDSSNKSDKAVAVQFPQGNEASLIDSDVKVTYTILESSAESYNAENQKVTVKIRCLLGEGRFGMNFWSSSFRLIADDLPYAAQGNLNELVENESFKDGEVYFLIPKDARAADLQLRFGDQTTILPLKW